MNAILKVDDGIADVIGSFHQIGEWMSVYCFGINQAHNLAKVVSKNVFLGLKKTKFFVGNMGSEGRCGKARFGVFYKGT
jgi:hypothetical protein